MCGSIDDFVFVGYHPHIGMPIVGFTNLRLRDGSGIPTSVAFHSHLADETGYDFSVVELRKNWLGLDVPEQNRVFDSVVEGVVRSELANSKVQNTMLPFNPVFGPNRYIVQENMVFVIMPFSLNLTGIYNAIVKPTVEAKNLICRRGDDINSNNAIISDIWKSICEARFIIADLSTRNPNVMYELGIAHTVGKETILIHQNSDQERFPFDISHFRIIDYQDSATGGEVLRTKLSDTIDSVLQKISSLPIQWSQNQ